MARTGIQLKLNFSCGHSAFIPAPRSYLNALPNHIRAVRVMKALERGLCPACEKKAKAHEQTIRIKRLTKLLGIAEKNNNAEFRLIFCADGSGRIDMTENKGGHGDKLVDDIFCHFRSIAECETILKKEAQVAK